MCIRTTIFDAVAHGYHVININDATSAQSAEIAAANILDIRNMGVECLPAEDFISSLGAPVNFDKETDPVTMGLSNQRQGTSSNRQYAH